MSTPSLLCALLLVALSVPLRSSEFYQPGTSGDAQLVVDGGLSVLRVHGDQTAMGSQVSVLCKGQIGILVRMLVHSQPAGALAMVPVTYRSEVEALAKGSDLTPAAIASADLLVDSYCTAIAVRDTTTKDQPLLLGRNMDFKPAGLLGSATLVMVFRGNDVHAFASVGWPGFSGVISGLNDAGVVVCLLLNQATGSHVAGEAICFRLREILERATTLAEAAKLFAASPVASSHYVMIADGQAAAVLWQDDAGFHQDGMHGEWLSCTNGARAADGHSADTRGRWVAHQCQADAAAADPAWLRRALTGCYITDLNAEAMVFLPGQRRLELALGSGSVPAALATWGELDLAPLLSGEVIAKPLVKDLGKVPDPLQHY